MSEYLFVYGSLRSAAGTDWSRRLAANAELIGAGRVQGSLFQLGQFSGLVLSRDADRWVVGEVHRLHNPETYWPVLDEYEGSEYPRCVVEVRLDDGRHLSAWVYYYQGDVSNCRRIESGDYLRPV